MTDMDSAARNVFGLLIAVLHESGPVMVPDDIAERAMAGEWGIEVEYHDNGGTTMSATDV